MRVKAVFRALTATNICGVSAFLGTLGRLSHMARSRCSNLPGEWRQQCNVHMSALDEEKQPMGYVAMNRFKVKIGCEDDFEQVWRERESKLQNFSGFKTFMLLRVDESGGGVSDVGRSKAGYTEFVSHTVWAHKIDFEEWRKSQAFKGSHSGGNDKGEDRQAEGSKGSRPILPGKMGELLLERPTPAMYDAILVEPVPAEHRGGLWEFENEASYFDGDVEIEERQ